MRALGVLSALGALVLLFTGCSLITNPSLPSKGDLFLSTHSGLVKVSLDSGAIEVLLPGGDLGSLAAKGGKIYFLPSDNTIHVYDRDGDELSSIPLPEEMATLDFMGLVALGDNGFALLNNHDDKVYFISSTGELTDTVGILPTPDAHFQNMYGIVVAGKLIISEDGHMHLVSVELNTHEVSVFRDLSHICDSYLGPLAYSDGRYYVCGPRSIYVFEPGDDDVTKIGEVPQGSIIGIVVLGNYAYTCSNRGGAIYRTDLTTGETDVFVDGLDYPWSMAFLPGE